MEKRYIPVVSILVACAAVAIIGYFMPAKDEVLPVRVLLDNAGGEVVFDHAVHAEAYGFACADCHHEMPLDADTSDVEAMKASVISCGSCHGLEFDEEFVATHESMYTTDAQCATCHHVQFDKTDWGHDMHAYDFGMDCLTCHHDTDIEPEPMNCNNCHTSGYTPADDPMPSLKNAVHARCESCHFDYYDEGIADCASCHYDTSSQEKMAKDSNFEFNSDQMTCITCHEDVAPAELIPSRMDAFHLSCMGCHEEIGAGPYTADDCAKCHL